MMENHTIIDRPNEDYDSEGSLDLKNVKFIVRRFVEPL